MADKRLERHLGALVEAGMTLASELDLDALLQRIADLSREVIGAHYAAVGVLGDVGTLTRFIHSGIDDATVERIGDLPRGRGVLGVLVEQRQPLRLREISEHPRSYGFPEHHPPMHSFLGVPIVVRDQVFGRLYLTEKLDSTGFTKDDERIALTFASQAGVAIENASLYQEVHSRSAELVKRMGELASVERVGDLLISGSSIDEVLRSTTGEAVALTGASLGLLLLLDQESGDLVVNQVGGTKGPKIGTRLAAGTAKGHAVLRRMKAEVVDDLRNDPEIHQETIEALGNPSAAGIVPMMVGSRGLGTLAVYDRTDERPFTQDDLAILQILANQAAIALENARLSEALRDLAVLEERERIAKELHDGVIQSIYSVGLHLQGSTSLLQKDPDMANKRIGQAIAELDNVVRDVRSYIFELRPHAVQERGLAEAIRELARDLEVNTLAHVTVEIDSAWVSNIEHDQQQHLIQITRELLSNIARHSEASEVSINGTADVAGEVVLEIVDNGIGFDPKAVNRGHGLNNIEQRVQELGGTIEMTRGDSKGMRVVVRIPAGKEAAR